MAATADPPESDDQCADTAAEGSAEETEPDPFEQKVQRLLDEGMSIPAIADAVPDYGEYHISAFPKDIMRYSP